MKTHTQESKCTFLWPSAMPLRVVQNPEGWWEVWTKQDDSPGSMNNAIVAQFQFEPEARLFASAPELLAALKKAMVWIDGEEWAKNLDNGELKQFKFMFEARDAIARAEGRDAP